jgi:hypothetical protein
MKAKAKTVRVKVRLPRGAGPWLYVDGQFVEGLRIPGAVAKAVQFPGPSAWEAWGRGRAWRDALCYFLRGKYGAKEIAVKIEVPE